MSPVMNTSFFFYCSHPLAVQIYAEKQAYPTNTDVTFLAMAEETAAPAEFLWHFGDSSSASRDSSSRSITKRFSKPGRCEMDNIHGEHCNLNFCLFL